MTTHEISNRQSRDALPSINNLDFEKYRLDKADHIRFSVSAMNTMAKSGISSPPSTYSGPPPPYSSTISGTGQNISGYISPPETSSRRSTRDDKDSLKANTSLPSISEALKNAEVSSTTQTFTSISAPGSAIAQTFSDAPKGPGNPFSQPGAPASALRSSLSSGHDPSVMSNVPPPPAASDNRQPSLIDTSPRRNIKQRVPGPLASTSTHPETPFRSSYLTESPRPGYPFPDHHATHVPFTPSTPNTFSFEHSKIDDSRNPFAKQDSLPYNETVKRHLEVYDAELTLSEIAETTAHTLDVSKIWIQRYHQANRTSYVTDGLPSTAEIDEVLRYSQHVTENLSRLRDVAVVQQNAIDEQRARAARGPHIEDDFHRMSEDYKTGGFAGGDAKKRRGKAAPPGRCHSCNRAETPEWRRGPDGARTLCNACGLHYAKLTRKMGANKAAVMTGSNLRPKSLSETHQ